MSKKLTGFEKKRRWGWLWLLLLGIILGAALLAGTATVFHKTSDTAFCVSCHTMQQPLAEYQGSVRAVRQAGMKPILLATLLFVWLLVGGSAINQLVQHLL